MTPWQALNLALDSNERYIEGEHLIASQANAAYKYARDIIKARWEPGERIIATDAAFAVQYAKNIIKGRWEFGEPTIAKDQYWAFWYAMHVIERRFIEGEILILRGENRRSYLVKFRHEKIDLNGGLSNMLR